MTLSTTPAASPGAASPAPTPTWNGWEGLGLDEGGLPAHLPMPVTRDGQGPAHPHDTDHFTCWCGTECPLARALTASHALGAFTAPAEGSPPADNPADSPAASHAAALNRVCAHDPRYSRSECACGDQVSWCDLCQVSLCSCDASAEDATRD